MLQERLPLVVDLGGASRRRLWRHRRVIDLGVGAQRERHDDLDGRRDGVEEEDGFVRDESWFARAGKARHDDAREDAAGPHARVADDLVPHEELRR